MNAMEAESRLRWPSNLLPTATDYSNGCLTISGGEPIMPGEVFHGYPSE